MPSHEEHCQDSLRRYGKRFSELHRWMDEPSTLLGRAHRKYRHEANTTPQLAKRLFGELADQACLDHIRLDELESRRKGIKRIQKPQVSRTRRPRTSNAIGLGFISLMCFITGLTIISTGGTTSVIGGLMFFFFSFLSFIGALSNIGEERVQKKTTYQYADANVWEKDAGRDLLSPHNMGYLDNICPECGTLYEAKLGSCPKCGSNSFALKSKNASTNEDSKV